MFIHMPNPNLSRDPSASTSLMHMDLNLSCVNPHIKSLIAEGVNKDLWCSNARPLMKEMIKALGMEMMLKRAWFQGYLEFNKQRI